MTPLTFDHPLAFLDGHPLPSGGLCIIAALWGLDDEDERPTKLVILRHGKPFMVDIPANVIDVTAIVEGGVEKIVALARTHEVFVVRVDDASVVREPIRLQRPEFGGLTGLHTVDSNVLAYGMFGQVYMRHGPANWGPFCDGLYTPVASVDSPMITAMAGTSFDTLHAVGASGLLARCDGHRWSRIDTPTNVNLNQVTMTASGHVVACGDRGIVVKGSGDQWDAVDTGAEVGFWGIADFRGTLYLSAFEGLCTFDPERGAAPLDLAFDPEITSYRLTADAESLWSIGQGDVLRFDGRQWTRAMTPEGLDNTPEGG